jgi:heme/copper-type cytochrome/quinol oxidase subunit 4
LSKETLVFIFGILLTIIPFLGIPEDWRQYAILGIGVFLIIMGYALRRRVYLNRIDHGNG